MFARRIPCEHCAAVPIFSPFVSGVEKQVQEIWYKTITILPENIKIAPMNMRMPRAVNVAMCGRKILNDGKIDNVMNIEPLYIRRSEAEVLWKDRKRYFGLPWSFTRYSIIRKQRQFVK